MGGKGSGGYRAGAVPRDKNPLIQANSMESVNPSTNSKALGFCSELFTWPAPDYGDSEAMSARFLEFLRLCDRWEVRPQVTTCAAALGMNRDAFTRIAKGDRAYANWHDGALTPESTRVIQKAHELLACVWEVSLTEEKGNPVKWIFLGKNYYGMRDQSEHVVSSPQSGPELPSPEEVAEKYAKMVGKPPELTEGE